MDPLVLGTWLLLGATGIMGLVVVLARLVAQNKDSSDVVLATPLANDLLATQDAVLLVQRGGGRVIYTNQHTREWFGYQNEEPSLERLARRARPRMRCYRCAQQKGRCGSPLMAGSSMGHRIMCLIWATMATTRGPQPVQSW